MKKKVNVTLDKLDQEFLAALKERTGKSDSDILKMALSDLHRKLVEGIVDNKQPQIIYVQPPLFQPYQPLQITPPPPIYPPTTMPSPFAPFDPHEVIVITDTAPHLCKSGISAPIIETDIYGRTVKLPTIEADKYGSTVKNNEPAKSLITVNSATGTTVNTLNDEAPISTTGFKYPTAKIYNISERKDL